jgi:cyclopropane fatty-acyl-phospholipid synthase-like methyltransferase
LDNINSLTFSQACENNKQPILDKLAEPLAQCCSVLEVGSGTGQHAVHFSRHLPHLVWQPSDRSSKLSSLLPRLKVQGPSNCKHPIALDIDDTWPLMMFDAIYTANTLHIVSEKQVSHFFKQTGSIMPKGGQLFIYGPFKYNGDFTSASNQAFDLCLKSVDEKRGIRDFEKVRQLAHDRGLSLVKDHSLPANNQLLHWVKT